MSALPAVVGPFLLLAAEEHGARFAAKAADGTLLGLTSLAAFAIVYGLLSQRTSWRLSLTSAWALAGLVAVLAQTVSPSSPGALLAAVGALCLARVALAGGSREGAPEQRARWDIPARMAVTALLVVVLALAAARFGALLGGLFAGLPVLASVLAVSTHRRRGAAAVRGLLVGMLDGMVCFVAFCETVALLATTAGVAVAFLAASALALLAQGLLLLLSQAARRSSPVAASSSGAASGGASSSTGSCREAGRSSTTASAAPSSARIAARPNASW